jgi:hypothetical protein
MSFQKEFEKIIDDLLSFVNQQLNSQNTIIVSPEIAKRWEELDTHAYTKYIKQVDGTMDSEQESQPINISNEEIIQEDIQTNEKGVNPPLLEVQDQLDLINKEVQQCTKCPLYAGRTPTVFRSR